MAYLGFDNNAVCGDIVSGHQYSTQLRWIGGNDINSEGNWLWVDNSGGNTGVSIDGNNYSRWHTGSGQPNNAGSQHCLEISRWGECGGAQVGEEAKWWNDLACSASLTGYLCEKRFQEAVTAYTPPPATPDINTYVANGWSKIPDDYDSSIGINFNCPAPETQPDAGTAVVYQFFSVPGGINWFDAKDACNALGDGVTLARSFCDRENHFMAYLGFDNTPSCDSNQHSNQLRWIGGNDINSEGDWVWVDNSGANTGVSIDDNNYSRWHGSGQPNDSGGQDCLEISRWGECESLGVGEEAKWWNDLACTASLTGYICEKRFY